MDLIRRGDLVLLTVDLQNGPLKQWEDSVALLEANRIVPDHLKDEDVYQQLVTYVPFVVLANKNDDSDSNETFQIFREFVEGPWTLISTSVVFKHNLELLKQTLVQGLDIIRVYSKSPGKKPDLSSPFVLKRGSTVSDFSGKIHKDFFLQLKSAKVWGPMVYDGQLVQRDYVLQDGDVVELQV